LGLQFEADLTDAIDLEDSQLVRPRFLQDGYPNCPDGITRHLELVIDDLSLICQGKIGEWDKNILPFISITEPKSMLEKSVDTGPSV